MEIYGNWLSKSTTEVKFTNMIITPSIILHFDAQDKVLTNDT